ncbi:MAG: MarR family transcriptional regulator, partial [Coriobacteriales bacterium]
MAASELSVGTRLDWINHFINVANAVDHNVKKACGLNITQGRILFYISTHELMTIGNVGTMLFLKASTITASVNKLVDEGYISRSHDDADRRNVFIASTRKGIEVTPSFIPAVRKAYEEDVPR